MEIALLTALDGVQWTELETLYRLAPRGNKTAEHLRTVFSNSRYCCLARVGSRLVGAGRAIADGADCSYICDVAVLPSHQGLGLGKAIVERLMDLSSGHRRIILYAVPGKQGFYKRLGFLRLSTAMAVFRDRESAIAGGYLGDGC